MKSNTAGRVSGSTGSGNRAAASASAGRRSKSSSQLSQVLHQPQGSPAQGKRIFVAAGRQADREQPDQRIQAVRQTDDQARLVPRSPVAAEARQVMLEDRLGDRLRFF